MTELKNAIGRREFLETSALTGGGLITSFSSLADFRLRDKYRYVDIPR